MAFTETEIQKMMRSDSNSATQAKLPNFRKIDQDILEQNRSQLKGMGFTLQGLKDQYGNFSFSDFGDTYKFGQSLKDLPQDVYSGKVGASSEYINNRIEVLNQVIGLFESAKTPEDLHKITALLEMSKNAAGDNKEHAAHYQEIIGAVKTAIANDAEAKQNFNQYEKSAIYDQATFSKTLNELVKRRDHLQAIKSQGYDSFERDGVVGRISDHGLQTGLETYGTYVTAKSLWSLRKVPSVLRHIKTLEAAGHTVKTIKGAPVLGRAVLASRSLWSTGAKYAGKVLGCLGPWGKAALAVGVVVYGGAKLYTSYNDKDSFLNNVGKTAKETFMGDAKNGLVALGSWILPGYGTLYGTDHFNSERDKQLAELKGVVA